MPHKPGRKRLATMQKNPRPLSSSAHPTDYGFEDLRLSSRKPQAPPKARSIKVEGSGTALT